MLALFLHQELEHTADFYARGMTIVKEGLALMWEDADATSKSKEAGASQQHQKQVQMHPIYEDLWVPDFLEALICTFSFSFSLPSEKYSRSVMQKIITSVELCRRW